MTASPPPKKPAAKKPPPKKPAAADGEGPVDVAELPDMQRGQQSEAMQQPVNFVLRDGTEVEIMAPVDWSFRADQALARGEVETWARGAVADAGRVDDLLDAPSRDLGRIVRYFDDLMGATRGEGSGSSGS